MTGGAADSLKLLVFSCAPEGAPPHMAVSLKQVVEVTAPEGVIGVDDPRSLLLGFTRRAETVVPVLDPEAWGAAQRPLETMQRLLFVRGASEQRVVAIPVTTIWIESLSPLGADRRSARKPQDEWASRSLAVVRLEGVEAYLLDLDAVLREQEQGT